MYWLTYDLCFPSSAHSLSYFINSSCFGFYSGKFRRSFSSCDTLSLMKPFLVWFPQPTRKLCWGNIYHFQCFPNSVFLVCPAPTRNICCEAKQCFRNIFLPHATNSGACMIVRANRKHAKNETLLQWFVFYAGLWNQDRFSNGRGLDRNVSLGCLKVKSWLKRVQFLCTSSERAAGNITSID